MNAIQKFNEATGLNLDPHAELPPWEVANVIQHANERGLLPLADELRAHFDAQKVARSRERERVKK